MKKILVALLAVAMASTMVVFAGCGNNGTSSNTSSATDAAAAETSAAADDAATAETTGVVGSWTLASITTADGTEQTLEEYCAAQGVDSAGMQATYTFEEGDKVTGDIGGVATEGTYTLDGTTLTVTFNGANSVFTYDEASSTLTAEDASTGVKSTFTKNA